MIKVLDQGSPLKSQDRPNIRTVQKILEEENQRRRLGHYEKYLKVWDNYENKIRKHFTSKEVARHGSEKAANEYRGEQVRRMLGGVD